jgi:hypothetical protein
LEELLQAGLLEAVHCNRTVGGLHLHLAVQERQVRLSPPKAQVPPLEEQEAREVEGLVSATMQMLEE